MPGASQRDAEIRLWPWVAKKLTSGSPVYSQPQSQIANDSVIAFG
jgi:hypothetical protein